jgi:hypothetical protein
MKTTRRKFLTGLAVSFGSALTPLGALALEAALSPSMLDNESYSVLTKHQLNTLAQVVDTIIPATGTPGAAEAKVHLFINHLLKDFLSDEQKNTFISGLNDLDTNASQGSNKLGFLDISKDEQLIYLQKVDNNRANNPFYRDLKQLTVIGYYTSEIGASKELNFSSVPGPYKEMPLAELGKAWS